MDIYEYLKMDHKKIAKLFELYKTAKTHKNKLEIFEMINQELIVHADSESKTFYKVLEIYQKSRDQALHGEDEHNEIKAKLAEICGLNVVNDLMERKLLELKELVEHHVLCEEGEIFNCAKKVISESEAIIIKEKMHDQKEKMLNYAIELDHEKVD